MADLELAGYDVVGPVGGVGVGVGVGAGVGAEAQSWRARRQADGRTVLLRPIAVPADAGDLDALRRTLARVGSLDGEFLLPMHTVATTDRLLVAVYDYPAGGSLPGLLAARTRLSVGEVVTLGTTLAAALTEIHRAGLSHGGLTEASVYLGLDGTPLLADVGLAAGEPGEDVRALAGICRRTLGTGRRVGLGPAAGLVSVLGAAEKRAETDAAGLGSLLRAAAPAVPIRFGDPGSGPSERPSPTEVTQPGSAGIETAEPAASGGAVAAGSFRLPGKARRRVAEAVVPRKLLAASVVLVALLAAVALGVQWARVSSTPAAVTLPARPSVTPSPLHPPQATDAGFWRGVMEALDARRSEAFAAADPAALAAADAPSSPALLADRKTAAELRRRGARPVGLRWEIVRVAVDSAGPPGVVLRVTDRMPAHDLVDSGGAVMVFRPARGESQWRVTLLPAADGWRIAKIEAV